MGEPLHSFVVLAFGESPYLEECLCSLEGQAAPSPVLIATSTPSPFLEAIARRHRAPLLVNPERRGIAGDWTFAYQRCTTKYLTLAHQDDLYFPDYSRACAEAAGRSAGSLITFTDYGELVNGRRTDRHPNLLMKRVILGASFRGRTCLADPRRKRRLLAFGCPIGCPSVMYDRTAIGDFAFSAGYEVNLDWDAWTRLAEREGGFCYVPRTLVVHRMHQRSATSRNVRSGVRQHEDRLLLGRYWPRAAADIIARWYGLSLGVRRAINFFQR